MASSPTPDPTIHLAIIPDGNRRWAKAHKFANVWKGHERAVENFRTLTEWCRSDPRIGILTVWCFSTENWKRDTKEVAMLLEMLENYLRKEQKGFLDQKTRFVHSGRRDRIPKSLKQLIEETEELTRNQTGFTLHLAVDYGGKDEILRAVARAGSGQRAAGSDFIQGHLDHPELRDIDLIFRSSGEYRTSNFFLWQSTYAEWYFSPKLFPDVTPKDLEEAVTEFERRKRRYGG